MKRTFAAVASFLVIVACGERETATQTDTAPAPAPQTAAPAAAPSPGGAHEITVDVDGTGFTPASVNVPAGQPLRIHFKRGEQPTCADEVVFAGLDIRKELPPNQVTTVELPPQNTRTLTFACGMDMLKGKLVVQ